MVHRNNKMLCCLTVLHYKKCYLQAAFKDKIHFNSHYPGSDVLPNTCNVSILGPTLQGDVHMLTLNYYPVSVLALQSYTVSPSPPPLFVRRSS